MPSLIVGTTPKSFDVTQNGWITMNEKEFGKLSTVSTPSEKYEHIIISSISTFFTQDYDYDPRKLGTISRRIGEDGVIFIPKSSPNQSSQRQILMKHFDKEGFWSTLSNLPGYDAFQRFEFSKEDFVCSLYHNIKSFIEHKVRFYANYLLSVKKEYELIQSRIARLKEMKYDLSSPNAIRDLFPTYSTTALFIVSLEELIDRLKEQNAALTIDGVKSSLKEVLFILQTTVGNATLKNKLIRIILNFGRNWKVFTKQFNNFCIMGESGVGKTQIAKVIGAVFEKVGLLSCGSVQIVSRSDIVASYVGQTASKTRSLLLDSLEGVVFVDEAYSLVEGGSKDYGTEAITEMVNFMDKFVGMSVVIVAGYKGVMEKKFLKNNEGLSRRFPHRYELGGYNIEELSEIVRKNIVELSDIHPPTSLIIPHITASLTKYKVPFKHHASDMVLIANFVCEYLGDGLDEKESVEKGFERFFEERKPK